LYSSNYVISYLLLVLDSQGTANLNVHTQYLLLFNHHSHQQRLSELQKNF